MNDQRILDVRKVVTGKDGQVFITTRKGVNIFLAEVDTFQAQLNANNTDLQPVGSALVYGVTTGHSITVAMTEAVVRDDVIMEEILEELTQNRYPTFEIQGKLNRRDGGEQRLLYRRCILDGTFDLQNLQPGDIIRRQMSFRVNANPEMLSIFDNPEIYL